MRTESQVSFQAPADGVLDDPKPTRLRLTRRGNEVGAWSQDGGQTWAGLEALTRGCRPWGAA
jgi:hypothetical protein